MSKRSRLACLKAPQNKKTNCEVAIDNTKSRYKSAAEARVGTTGASGGGWGLFSLREANKQRSIRSCIYL